MLRRVAAGEAASERISDRAVSVEELNAMVAPTLAEAGCRAYQPYVQPNRPGSMVVIEEWDDERALQTHFATSHFNQVVIALQELLIEPFTLSDD